MKNKRFYIAYGSNMNLRQMEQRCPEALVHDSFFLEGYELTFKGTGNFYATIEPKENSKVPVVLWDISENDELNLDRYEGYPSFYRKEELKLSVGNENYEVMVYVMNAQIYGVPSQRYIDTIAEGYRSAGFDEEILYRFLEDNVDNIIHKNKKLEKSEISSREYVEGIRTVFEKGDSIELLEDMEDMQGLKKGAKATVRYVDDMGTVHVGWEEGRSLGVIPSVDKLKLIKNPEKDQHLEPEGEQMDML